MLDEALALFNHVVSGIKGVQNRIAATQKELTSGAKVLLSRFPKEATVYPHIETLGAATDLDGLRAKVDNSPGIEDRIEALRRTVAALEANTVEPQIKIREREELVLGQAVAVTKVLGGFNVNQYNGAIVTKQELHNDYRSFRTALFEAADLPAEPDDTWEAFIASGETYRKHLHELGRHDADRCLYCRQQLNSTSQELVAKYSDYLADKISHDIKAQESTIGRLALLMKTADSAAITAFVKEYGSRTDQPNYFTALVELDNLLASAKEILNNGTAMAEESLSPLPSITDELATTLATTTGDLKDLREQARNRVNALAEQKKALNELLAAAELGKSWPLIEEQVKNAKESDRLSLLGRALPNLSRAVTGLSKTASNQLINQSFDRLFAEECQALRAPDLKLQFVGREGKAQRRKVLGSYKPSKILSEGEQKVIALSDFIAEARLAGITAPVIFDDPVSSLDHRRIDEVAYRVAKLAEDNQVIVFTHDILFAARLLSLFEKSKRCTYYQVTDDEGKGKVTHATGPRWDTLKNLRAKINQVIQDAHQVEGEARAALVCTGYDWIRSWCEVFTEKELLKGVTERYQPNVRMTALPDIKVTQLPSAIETVVRIFEQACRYIDGHSQPLPTLGVSPTLSGLEAHWQELQDCKKDFDAA